MTLHCGFTASARFGFGWFCAQVKHLEVSCSSMAEDICRKSAIIETYVMDSRIGNPQSGDAAAESEQQCGFSFPYFLCFLFVIQVLALALMVCFTNQPHKRGATFGFSLMSFEVNANKQVLFWLAI